MELIELVAVTILAAPIVSDGVEQGNSIYKWVQAGRVRLSSPNAAKLVYIIINQRLMKQYEAELQEDKKPGAFKLLRGWPPKLREMGSPVTEVDEEENEAGTKELLRVQSLVDTLEQVEAEEAADAIAKAANRCETRGSAEKRKREEAERRAASGQAGESARRELKL